MTTDLNTDLMTAISDSTQRRFVPLAYYDKHMDCIRIELRDCSVCEHRVDQIWTVLYDNYPEPNHARIAGLTFKGVKHFFMKWGLPLEGIVFVTDLLDRIVKEMSKDDEGHIDAEVQTVIESVKQAASAIELPVNMSDQILAA